jgi:hypothetical protein
MIQQTGSSAHIVQWSKGVRRTKPRGSDAIQNGCDLGSDPPYANTETSIARASVEYRDKIRFVHGRTCTSGRLPAPVLLNRKPEP